MATNNAVNLKSSGMVSYDAAGTFAGRTIAAGSSKISVSNGDGIAGAPSIDAVEANFTLNNIGGTLGETKGGTNQTTYATGDILYASAANTLSKLTIGSASEVLTVTGGIPAWEAPSAGGGAWEFISASTASSSATISFTGLSSTYYMYMVVITNMQPVTDNTSFRMRTSTDGGSSYDSGAGNYSWSYVNVLGGATSTDTSIIIQPGLSNASNELFSATIFIYDPSSANYCRINGYTSYITFSSVHQVSCNAGARLSAADVDAIQFSMSSGNISIGEFKLYGLLPS